MTTFNLDNSSHRISKNNRAKKKEKNGLSHTRVVAIALLHAVDAINSGIQSKEQKPRKKQRQIQLQQIAGVMKQIHR